MQEEVDIKIASEKIKEGNNFNINNYGLLSKLGIESKYSNYIGISNGKIYIKQEAEQRIKDVAIGLGMEVAKIETVDGSNELVMQNGEKIKNYRIYGSAEGVGQSVTGGYRIPITVSGKNLFNINDYIVKGTPTYEIAENTMNITVDFYNRLDYKIKVKPNTEYILSEKAKKVGECSTLALYINGTSTYWNHPNGSNAITSRADGTIYLRFATGSEITATYEISNIQLEEGNVSTTYEPYVEQRTYEIIISEPLRSSEEGTDYIDFSKQKVIRMVDENNELLLNAEEEPISIPEILTHEGTNIITVGTEIQPSKIEVEY